MGSQVETDSIGILVSVKTNVEDLQFIYFENIYFPGFLLMLVLRHLFLKTIHKFSYSHKNNWASQSCRN